MTLRVEPVTAYHVTWKGTPISDVYFQRQEAVEYKKRVRARYTDGTLDLLAAASPEDPAWEATWPIGEDADGQTLYNTERVQATYKKDAKQILRDKLDRKRLPNGIEWEKVR